jgi:hypothetical protein
MTKWNQRIGARGTILPTALGVAVAGIGFGVWAAGPYNLDGSDTLGEVAPYTITQSGANLAYRALGSTTGENNLVAGTQTVAFMSRNFKSAVLGSHSSWAPSTGNVLGLDAAVLVTSSWASRMQNVTLPNTVAPTGKFDPDNDMSLILAGAGAAGTDAACRSSARMAAYKRWATAMHTSGYIDHFYRRNDASGTSDTIRERVLTTSSGTSGGRFCNGQASGGVKSDGVTLYTNMDAEDFDPIRRDCPAEVRDSSDNLVARATKCIYYPYNYACTYGQTAAGTETVNGETIPSGTACTQGLVVALTQGDPDLANPGKDLPVTVSIAQRVAADIAHSTLGFAGREAVKTAGIATAGPTINKTGFADASVRQNFYPLARRLFLNRGDDVADAGRLAEENILYDYAVNNNGRCHMQPIMSKFGFVTCHANCNSSTWGTSYNLCEDGDIPVAESTMTLCVASGKSCPASGTMPICCSTGATCVASAVCGDVPKTASGLYCNSSAECASGTCTSSSVCQ